MKPLLIHDEAESELWAEVDYYEQAASGLGMDFLAEVMNAMERVQNSPTRWQFDKYGTQRIVIQRFPHTIYFINLAAAIWVVAIAPQKRRPFYWRNRLTSTPNSRETP